MMFVESPLLQDCLNHRLLQSCFGLLPQSVNAEICITYHREPLESAEHHLGTESKKYGVSRVSISKHHPIQGRFNAIYLGDHYPIYFLQGCFAVRLRQISASPQHTASLGDGAAGVAIIKKFAHISRIL